MDVLFTSDTDDEKILAEKAVKYAIMDLESNGACHSKNAPTINPILVESQIPKNWMGAPIWDEQMKEISPEEFLESNKTKEQQEPYYAEWYNHQSIWEVCDASGKVIASFPNYSSENRAKQYVEFLNSK